MTIRILTGDCRDVLRTLPDESVHCVVTSPPYFGLRDYGVAGQIGLEHSPAAYVAELVAVFRAVWRVLRSDATCWLNLGDSYAAGKNGRSDQDRNKRNTDGRNPANAIDTGSPFYEQRKAPEGFKAKDLLGIPWRVAFALQADGWYLRQDIIWSKPNPMPESVRDRCTKAHEYLFLLSKSERYHYDADAIAETSVIGEGAVRRTGAVVQDGTLRQDVGRHSINDGTRNRRSVWEVTTSPFPEAHFATFPPALIEPCIKAGCPVGGTVLDPFGGAGTTGLVADRLQRDAILIELNPEYAAMAERRIRNEGGMFSDVRAEEHASNASAAIVTAP